MQKQIWSEAKVLLGLAVPIGISQISRVGMGVVDTMFAGNVSPRDLAAVGLGTAVWLAVFFFVSGALLVAAPLVGQRSSKSSVAEMNSTLGQVSTNSLFWGAAASVLLLVAGKVVGTMDMDPYVTALARDYTYVMALGALPCALFQGLKFCFDGLGQPSRGMKIGIAGFLINIPLNYVFVFGAFGIPGMGGLGCAWATTICYWIMAILLVASARREPAFAGAKLILLSKPLLEDQRYLFAKGVPAGLAILLDAGFFSAIALLSVGFGALSVAANHIATNFVSLLFVGHMAISMAISIRIARATAQQGAGRSVTAGLLLSGSLSLCCVVVLSVFGSEIAALYSPDPQVQELAMALLMVAALFQFIDAIQVCFSGALRGMHDTFVPMVVVGLAYWAIAFPIAYVQTYTEHLGKSTIVSVWYGLSAGISFAAIALTARFVLKLSGPRTSSVPALSP